MCLPEGFVLFLSVYYLNVIMVVSDFKRTSDLPKLCNLNYGKLKSAILLKLLREKEYNDSH